jgi:IclR family transcriptional regulator, KDG regulon repressor
MAENTSIHSVVTTLNIIETMAESGHPLGVSELARSIGITKPRIFRHLRTLVDEGYVMQNPSTEKYQLSLKLFHIGQSIGERVDFISEARRVMPKLMEDVKQTVTLGQIDENGIRIMDILRCRSAIEITTPPGTLLGFHSSAQGKIALAFGPDSLWEKIENEALVQFTSKTITDIGRLKKEIDSVKTRGWAEAPGQALIGVNAMAAPVFDKYGALEGILAIVGSVQFLEPKKNPELRISLLDAAHQVSLRMGHK